MDVAERRRAHNETLFREVNERVEEVSVGLAGREDEALIGFVCECGRDDCTAPLEVTHAKYEAVRHNPRRFLVIPGHEHTDTATVVERHEQYLVVEKRGDAARIAEEHDSRA